MQFVSSIRIFVTDAWMKVNKTKSTVWYDTLLIIFTKRTTCKDFKKAKQKYPLKMRPPLLHSEGVCRLCYPGPSIFTCLVILKEMSGKFISLWYRRFGKHFVRHGSSRSLTKGCKQGIFGLVQYHYINYIHRAEVSTNLPLHLYHNVCRYCNYTKLMYDNRSRR